MTTQKRGTAQFPRMNAAKRAAIYARFSSDLQDARLIDDQVALCCEYAQRKGYAVARVYQDAAASGASRHGRPGLARMLLEAEADAFQVLLAESMSRIGHDPEDRAAVRKHLKFFGITTCAADGKAAASLRELIVAIVISPPADGRGKPLVNVQGRMAGLTGEDIFPHDEIVANGGSGGVAGAGIEPATYGL